MPGGRPTKYEPEYLERVTDLCANGATDSEIADDLGVSVATLYNWRNRYPEFLEALKTNKGIADHRVERSLFERATGYERDAVKIFLGKDGKAVKVVYREHVPPDPTSMIFWLKNRKKDEWRDKTDVEHTGEIKTVVVSQPAKDLSPRPESKPVFDPE